MTSSTTDNKAFHSYENVGYDDQLSNNRYATNNSGHQANPIMASIATNSSGNIAINKTGVESPFPDPLNNSNCNNNSSANKILSATDSSGTTRMLTSKPIPGHGLVTKLISFPAQSPMDSFKEWSISTFKCTKQIINEKRGCCSVTNDAQIQIDIDHLRDTKEKLVQMLRVAQQLHYQYSQIFRTQRQMHGLMNEMSVRCFPSNPPSNDSRSHSAGKHVVTNFSSLGNNLSSTTTSSPSQQTAHSASNTLSDGLVDFLPILNHMKSSSVDISEDLKKNSILMNVTIRNGEKLLSALSFFCSNLSTLINKTIEDTIVSVKNFESARLEYDAERNSFNFGSPATQTSINYSSDKVEIARIKYEQSKEDVQIKMRFLEENTIKVLHKQLTLFHSAFASYCSGNTAALETTLRQFSIR